MGTFGGAKEEALSPDVEQAFPITAESVVEDQSLANRDQLTREKVEVTLRQRMIGDSPGWGRARGAIDSTQGALTGTTAELIQILAGLGYGTPDADDFERFSLSDLGELWTIVQDGDGNLAIPDGHNAGWIGLTTAEFVARKNDKVAAGNMQTSTVVLGTTPQASGWPVVQYGQNDIWLRCTEFDTWEERTGARFRFGANRVISLTWVEDGVESEPLFEDEVDVRPATSAVFEFKAGLGSNERRFIARQNGTLVMDFVDEDEITKFGPEYRHRGFGGYVDAALLVVARPGRLKQWTAQG